jgi:hypothetical protein
MFGKQILNIKTLCPKFGDTGMLHAKLISTEIDFVQQLNIYLLVEDFTEKVLGGENTFWKQTSDGNYYKEL